VKCPICKKAATDDKLLPFCSERCKRVDLGRWLSEDYRISRAPTPEDESSLPVVEHSGDDDGLN